MICPDVYSAAPMRTDKHVKILNFIIPLRGKPEKVNYAHPVHRLGAGKINAGRSQVSGRCVMTGAMYMTLLVICKTEIRHTGQVCIIHTGVK